MTGLHAALAELAKRGPRGFDLNPTLPTQGRDTGWWLDYLRRLNEFWMSALRALLDEHPADLPVATDSTTAALVERSSFGTPEATALRASVSDEVAARVVARVKELEADAPEPSDRAGLSETELRDVRAAFERDRWAGEFNSLPTAIDRVLSRRADRLAVAEQERDEARVAEERSRQAAKYAHEVGLRHQDARDAADQKVAALRAQVEALHGKTHWCFGGDDVNDLRDDKVFEPGTDHWPCPTLGALGDSAQVVQRIKDEAAADALEQAVVHLDTMAARFLAVGEAMGLPFTGEHRAKHAGYCEAARAVEHRARWVRDGGDHG